MYGFPFATNAALKMYELIYAMGLVDCNKPIYAFCDAELPGAFIVALNHYIKTKCKNTAPFFDWVGSSYYPESAAKVGDTTILGDKYGLYANNRAHWLMGPPPNALPRDSPESTGDLTNKISVQILSSAVHARFKQNKGATLATGDAGIDVSADYTNQENSTALLNYGQVLAAIMSLAPGGNLVTKQYTFNTPFNRSLIALMAYLFEEAYITKPVTSRPANSEIYLVGKGFKSALLDFELVKSLLERLDSYSARNVSPCDGPPLFNPAGYAQADQVMLEAAREIHEIQQVNFLPASWVVFSKF